MTPEAWLARLHGLDDEGWARHANPWSGWTRFATGLPLLIVAIWSRTWIGWWSLGLLVLALVWLWWNPRAFPPARSDAPWMTKAVLGERFWVRRDELTIPARHDRAPRRIALAATLGLPFLVWGLAALDPWPTALGLVVTIGGKLWFVDRMALLYDEVVAERPDLRYRPPASSALG